MSSKRASTADTTVHRSRQHHGQQQQQQQQQRQQQRPPCTSLHSSRARAMELRKAIGGKAPLSHEVHFFGGATVVSNSYNPPPPPPPSTCRTLVNTQQQQPQVGDPTSLRTASSVSSRGGRESSSCGVRQIERVVDYGTSKVSDLSPQQQQRQGKDRMSISNNNEHYDQQQQQVEYFASLPWWQRIVLDLEFRRSVCSLVTRGIRKEVHHIESLQHSSGRPHGDHSTAASSSSSSSQTCLLPDSLVWDPSNPGNRVAGNGFTFQWISSFPPNGYVLVSPTIADPHTVVTPTSGSGALFINLYRTRSYIHRHGNASSSSSDDDSDDGGGHHSGSDGGEGGANTAVQLLSVVEKHHHGTAAAGYDEDEDARLQKLLSGSQKQKNSHASPSTNSGSQDQQTQQRSGKKKKNKKSNVSFFQSGSASHQQEETLTFSQLQSVVGGKTSRGPPQQQHNAQSSRNGKKGKNRSLVAIVRPSMRLLRWKLVCNALHEVVEGGNSKNNNNTQLKPVVGYKNNNVTSGSSSSYPGTFLKGIPKFGPHVIMISSPTTTSSSGNTMASKKKKEHSDRKSWNDRASSLLPSDEDDVGLTGYDRKDVSESRLQHLANSESCKVLLRCFFDRLEKDINGKVTKTAFVEFWLDLINLYLPSFHSTSNIEMAEDEWLCRL